MSDILSYVLVIGILVLLLIALIATPIIYSSLRKGQQIWKTYLLGAAGYVVFEFFLHYVPKRIINYTTLFYYDSWKDYLTDYYKIISGFFAVTDILLSAFLPVIGIWVMALVLKRNIKFSQGMSIALGYTILSSLCSWGMSMPNSDILDIFSLIASFMYCLAWIVFFCYMVSKKKILAGFLITVGIRLISEICVYAVSVCQLRLFALENGAVLARVPYILWISLMGIGATVFLIVICSKWKKAEKCMLQEITESDIEVRNSDWKDGNTDTEDGEL